MRQEHVSEKRPSHSCIRVSAAPLRHFRQNQIQNRRTIDAQANPTIMCPANDCRNVRAPQKLPILHIPTPCAPVSVRVALTSRSPCSLKTLGSVTPDPRPPRARVRSTFLLQGTPLQTLHTHTHTHARSSSMISRSSRDMSTGSEPDRDCCIIPRWAALNIKCMCVSMSRKRCATTGHVSSMRTLASRRRTSLRRLHAQLRRLESRPRHRATRQSRRMHAPQCPRSPPSKTHLPYMLFRRSRRKAQPHTFRRVPCTMAHILVAPVSRKVSIAALFAIQQCLGVDVIAM